MTLNEQFNNADITKCVDMHSMWDLAFCMTAKIKPQDNEFDSKLFQIQSQSIKFLLVSKYFNDFLAKSFC